MIIKSLPSYNERGITKMLLQLDTSEGFSFYKKLINAFISHKWILPESMILQIVGIDETNLEKVCALLSCHLPEVLEKLDLTCREDSPQSFRCILKTLDSPKYLRIKSVKLGGFTFSARRYEDSTEGENLARDTIQFFGSISERLEFSDCVFQCEDFKLRENIEYIVMEMVFTRCSFMNKRKKTKTSILTIMKAFDNGKLGKSLESIIITDETLTVGESDIKRCISWRSDVVVHKDY
ncbi:unnamed protein product [Moneuplotes crassus]|uniref:Uncharacterized protein n=1 Tax=Euplotes crassus TaxID=5936 RepID=A0AAD1U6D2_EUPCR|nr:unnamed protein product [Moneuplotes crassus]